MLKPGSSHQNSVIFIVKVLRCHFILYFFLFIYSKAISEYAIVVILCKITELRKQLKVEIYIILNKRIS